MVLAIFLTIALGTVTVLFANQKKVQPAIPVIIAVLPYIIVIVVTRIALKDLIVVRDWDQLGKAILISLVINFVVMFGGAGGMFLLARWYILRQAPPPGPQPPVGQDPTGG